MKLWEKGDKGKPLHIDIERFTTGDDPELDLALLPHDCLSSIAHAKSLMKAGVITEDECTALTQALEGIRQQALAGEFTIAAEDEDGQTALEHALVSKVGEAGKKIHTGRSRNDQVLAALRLYEKEQLANVKEHILALQGALAALAQKQGTLVFPGYTHTRKAMPSSVGYWTGGFSQALSDDMLIIDAAMQLIDQCPLGTGAGYGIPIALDTQGTAEALGFAKAQENGVHAQLSRGKDEWHLLQALGMVMHDLNRLAQDLILFSMAEFGYVILPDEVCTGSSIMPHKKNPDALELVRASYHEVVALGFQVAGTIGNLPSGYHRDLQLTKRPIIKGFEKTITCAKIMALVVDKLRFDEGGCADAMTPEVFATAQAYDLVKKGIAFRDAYLAVGKRYI